MLNRSGLRIAGLLAISGVLSGCSFLSWPYPRLIEHMEGLGTGRIADYVRREMSGRDEDQITADITKFLASSIPKKVISRQDAESLGLQCAPAPSTQCSYSGEFWYRYENIPSQTRAYGKRFIKSIEVRLSYLRPREFVVYVHEHVISEE
ncbi:exported hypothetical protein [Bradyrhizobium sp. STM 3843]|uniref:hypothetical protein n=1 Tax=Bradyrhizobium sp. STM 3843 TaxID=551947 RepID=UPI000240A3D9|nr:hypothetical protein [Bradyrhizobium sp. STM 3843]CCE04108.1 exported hypothetical protein [Bradyrhizobium sp. STM 3843]